MAQVAGTTETYDIIGAAEDVEDIIYDISPTETPFMSMAARKKASATLHQWQTDSLAAHTAGNAQIEGDDAAFATAVATTMLTNYTQISRKTLVVSETADVVRKYGRARELARLVTKYGKELKRDIEANLLSNRASSAGASSVSARWSAGLESMIAGNRVVAATNTTGTTPGFAAGVWSAPTDGTATATLTEAMMTEGIEAAWTDGGNPSVILSGFYQKKKIAQMSGATKYAGVSYNTTSKTQQGVLIGGVDLYISDAGEHKIMLSRFQRGRTLFGIDPDYVSVAWLRPIKMVELAKTGDAEKRMLIGEYCLVTDNPDAHWKVQDLPVA